MASFQLPAKYLEFLANLLAELGHSHGINRVCVWGGGGGTQQTILRCDNVVTTLCFGCDNVVNGRCDNVKM